MWSLLSWLQVHFPFGSAAFLATNLLQEHSTLFM
jgi:hypothetical protein